MVARLPWVITRESDIILPVHRAPLVLCLVSGWLRSALTVALGATNATTSHTVHVGNLPATASIDKLLNHVHFGPLKSIRVLPKKSCLDTSAAAQFYADTVVKKLSLHGQELKIGWGKPSPIPSQVTLVIQQSVGMVGPYHQLGTSTN